MTALEVKEYRGSCKKLVEAEERSKMLSVLLKNGVGLAEDEEFSRSNDKKFRIHKYRLESRLSLFVL